MWGHIGMMSPVINQYLQHGKMISWEKREIEREGVLIQVVADEPAIKQQWKRRRTFN